MKSNTNYSIKNFPVGLFNEVLKTGNYSLIDAPKKEQPLVWQRVFDEYLDKFGLSEDYKTYLELKGAAIDLYFKAFIEGQKHFSTLGEVKDRQAAAIIEEKTGTSFELLVASVSRFMSFRIDPEQVSVLEFYSYVELMQKSLSNGKKD